MGRGRGRPKGDVTNTEDTKELVIRLLKGGAKQFRDKFMDLADTNPTLYVKMYMALLEFVTPKVQRIGAESEVAPSFDISLIGKVLGESGEVSEKGKTEKD